MKFGYVSYVNPFAWPGGGELVSRELILAARLRGHEVAVVSVWPRASSPLKEEVDGWILVDIHNLPKRQGRFDQVLLGGLPRFPQENFRRVVSRARTEGYVHLDNAYVDTCDQPYLPCGGVEPLDTCPIDDAACFRLAQWRLYADAKACFFVSPLHVVIMERLHPEVHGRSLILRPTLDPTPFLAAHVARRDVEWLWVGASTAAKGFPDLEDLEGLTIVTPKLMSAPPQHATVLEGVPYEEMPRWFGRSRRFLFKPRWPEPFGRAVAEAALAGCELHVDGVVGALSFGRSLTDPALYAGAADEFWGRLETLFG